MVIIEIGEAAYLQYLGVHHDQSTIKEHIKCTNAKAPKVRASLTMLLTNIADSKQPIRNRIYSVVRSTLMYAALVWAEDR